ncbi:hypothetical protein HPP92_007849 [Vanilla planifolia]|uniref:WPP domain-containing protein n=1 Tax=Vanilla planifolia TaxID=51239 RepID=A0A835V941_VANPL|nr:hypothetical protein HPP92_007849 [Vanilla planifolia]
MGDESKEHKHGGIVNPENSESAYNPTATPMMPSIPSFSFKIWPPKQRTRDAVINRLIESLSAPSILSKRYRTLNDEDSSAIARLIEQEAFDFASASGVVDGTAKDSIDDGMEILKIYSKEISRRMLESIKARASPTTTASAESNASHVADDSVNSFLSDPNSASPSGEETS